MPTHIRAVAALLAGPLLLVACGGDDQPGAEPGGAATTAATNVEGTITVFAAASLTDAFEEIGATFEQANPGAAVEFNFAASSALREQILAGAPADVFASANQSNMVAVADGGVVDGSPTTFALNRLEIAAPAGNPGGVTGLADFADSELLIGLCAAEVPCGEFGREALGLAGVEPSIDTNEPDVRSLLTKVEEGELDAGIVYHTDVVAAGERVEGIEIPAEHNVVADYPIAALRTSGAAAAFVAYVVSPGGAAILERYGFDPA